MAQDLAGVVAFPGFAGGLGRVLLVEAHEQIDQLAAYGPGTHQIRKFRQIDEPLRVPGGPVVVGPVDDPEDTVVSLARLVQQGADLLQHVRHLVLPHIDDTQSRSNSLPSMSCIRMHDSLSSSAGSSRTRTAPSATSRAHSAASVARRSSPTSPGPARTPRFSRFLST